MSMKRAILAVVCSLSLFATASFAQQDATHASGGLGFHDIAAPVGLRWWFSGQKLGIDLGVGFGSDPSGIDPDKKVNHFAIDAGVPLVMHSWKGAHVLFRPGILYTSQQEGFDSDPGAGFTFDTDNTTALSIRAEIEGEIYLRDNVSVSASHGLEFVTDKAANTTPGAPDPDSQSSFGTIGRQFTQVGFHLYFLGAHQ
jgi:hypothetical protein